jgi:hypothetical protein
MISNCVAAAIVSVAALGLSACTTTFPDDLSAVSVAKVARADLPRVIGRDTQLPLFGADEDFLVVRIGTSHDVVSYALKRGSTLVANSWLCDSGVELATTSRLYAQGRDVRRDRQAKLPQPTTAGSYEYDTIHLILRSRSVEGRAAYNLRSAPQDVCLQVGGTDMMSTFESNIVRVTGKEIETAIGR